MTREEAKILAQKYLNIDDYPVVIVTANGNVYTSNNIDRNDSSERFNLKESAEVPTPPDLYEGGQGAKKVRKQKN